MYALVDCNNFFVSCERLFRPDLRQKPVCVLSSNDGCVVSLSNEAKKLGIQRGIPLFKIKDVIDKHNVTIFSSNFILYGGISERVMQIIANVVKDVEIYSIDEAFIDLNGFNSTEISQLMRLLVKRVNQWVGIPISIGVAPTKTLAKVAANYAKKYKGYKQVCVIDNEEKRVKALTTYVVGEVWGIGRQSTKKLESYDIKTAYDFTLQKESWVRKYFTITGVRTWKELQGVPVIDMSEITDKQSICTSRSFGTTVSSLESLKESVAQFTSVAAQKLRKQQSIANIVTVFILTDRFHKERPFYYNSQSLALPVASADTAELIHYAHQILLKLFLKGHFYKKAGVILSGIVPNSAVQQNIFDHIPNRERRERLNRVIDEINIKNGLQTVKYAIQTSTDTKWLNKTSFISPNYLTNINELFEVK